MKRKRQEEPVETTIVNESITVDQKVTEIDQRLAGLSEDEGLPLESLLVQYTKDELITTFMALLELMKKGRALAAQTETYAPILIYKGVVV